MIRETGSLYYADHTMITFVHESRVCLTKKHPQIAHASRFLLWGHPFGGDRLWGDLENRGNISKTHEPLCDQQCDQFRTKPDLRMCLCWWQRALLHDNAGLFSYGDAVYPPLRDAHFPDVMGRLPLASWFRWWRGMESMEKHGKLWAAWVGSSDWANHLQSQVKETMQRRKERFLSPAQAAWQETNPCKYSRFESVESQFSSCFEYSGPTHCIAFTSPKTKKKTTREPSAHWKPLTKDSSIPFACHAKENIVFIRAVARLWACVLAMHIICGSGCRLQSQMGQRVSGELHRGVAGDSSPRPSVETTF